MVSILLRSHLVESSFICSLCFWSVWQNNSRQRRRPVGIMGRGKTKEFNTYIWKKKKSVTSFALYKLRNINVFMYVYYYVWKLNIEHRSIAHPPTKFMNTIPPSCSLRFVPLVVGISCMQVHRKKYVCDLILATVYNLYIMRLSSVLTIFF